MDYNSLPAFYAQCLEYFLLALRGPVRELIGMEPCLRYEPTENERQHTEYCHIYHAFPKAHNYNLMQRPSDRPSGTACGYCG